MHKPSFITFTGIDDRTDLNVAHALAAQYPVEFGVLFSPSRQGKEPRYPSWATINKILMQAMPSGPRYAAHLCGDYSRQLLASAATLIDDHLVGHFHRIQVNTAQRGIDTLAVAQWAAPLGAAAILQCRDTFPMDENVSWLWDVSGGRGLEPKAWPAAPELPTDPEARARARLVGYAGGLGPKNIATMLPAIERAAGTSPYWIDMESGVRDENDWLDLGKCREVCEAVYGS